jgi:putative methionine-R-sulfoxide reductase with GAF domain
MDAVTKQEAIVEILDKDITPTTAVNILISAIDIACANPDIYTEVDKAMISKALNTLKGKVEEGKNFMIKVK